MVALDVRGARAAAGFHNIRVQGALDEETHVLPLQHGGHGALEGTDELRTNRLTLRLRLRHAGELAQEGVTLIHRHQLRAGCGHEVLLHLLALALAQQTVVNEHAGQTVADRALHQRRCDSGVHAARQTTDGVAVGADLGRDSVDKLLCNIRRRPGLLEPRDLREEAGEHLLTVRRVHDLRVVLHTRHTLIRILKGRDRRTLRRRGNLETFRRLRHGIAVAHPHGMLLRQASVEDATAHIHLRAAVLARTRLGHGATQRLSHHLEAVANAERGQAQLKDGRIELRRTGLIHRRRAAGQNERNRVLSFQFFSRDRVRHDLRVDARFTHATGNELRILRAEVHNKDWTRMRVSSWRGSHGFKV